MVHSLETFFNTGSIAVIGASEKHNSVGLRVFKNLIIAIPGNIGLISQSGAILSSILDWAVVRNIGFSSLFSLGNTINLDFDKLVMNLGFVIRPDIDKNLIIAEKKMYE